ncbi:hypothetical protein V6N13_004526 [Hibiscus sabdariffa]
MRPSLGRDLEVASSLWARQRHGQEGETLNDFSEDEENIASITEDDDVHLLDIDDVEIVRTVATVGNGMNVEDDVWAGVVTRLGLVNDGHVWRFVQTEPIVEDVWANVGHIYEVDYAAMRDPKHDTRVFPSSSASNYGELELKALFETKKDAQLAVKGVY